MMIAIGLMAGPRKLPRSKRTDMQELLSSLKEAFWPLDAADHDRQPHSPVGMCLFAVDSFARTGIWPLAQEALPNTFMPGN